MSIGVKYTSLLDLPVFESDSNGVFFECFVSGGCLVWLEEEEDGFFFDNLIDGIGS